jgi:antitoxin component YwqK of YwqJK toxin-antitoxin module
MRYLLLIVFCCFLHPVYAQHNDTTTQTGSNGLVYMIVNNEKGELMFTGSTRNGVKEGAQTTYFTETGYPKLTEIYYAGKKNGVSITIDATGYTNLVEQYKDDLLDGPRRVFAKGAFIAEEAYYKKGAKNGQYTSWYLIHNVKEKCNYVNDKREGKATWYYESQKVAAEYNYKNGEMDGATKSYNENGNLEATDTYIAGVHTGPAKEYYANGKIKAEGEYKNDIKVGVWKMYDEQGKMKKINYKEGEQKKS